MRIDRLWHYQSLATNKRHPRQGSSTHIPQHHNCGRMAAPGRRGRGRGRRGAGRGNPPHHFVWEGFHGPDMYEPPFDEFPLQGMDSFIGRQCLRPYDDRHEEWPRCAHGEYCAVQVFEEYLDGGRRFYRCPYGYVCAFIHPSSLLTVNLFSSNAALYFSTTSTWATAASQSGLILQTMLISTTTSATSKTASDNLQRRVNQLEDASDENALVIGIADDPKCPDHFCKCPYHSRGDWPPKSPPSGGTTTMNLEGHPTSSLRC